MKITLEISSEAWQEMKSEFIAALGESECGGDEKEHYARLILNAEADRPDRCELAMFLGSMAGTTGFSNTNPPTMDGWELPKFAK